MGEVSLLLLGGGSVLFTLVSLIVIDFIRRVRKSSASLLGQHVVITGGSSGIGKQFALQVAKRGAHVTILARDVAKLESTCKEIRDSIENLKDGRSQSINYFKADVTKYEDLEQALNRSQVEVGPIDILVNSAGYSHPSKLEDIPLKHIKGMMEINYLGTAYATRIVLPSMKSRRKGKIVIVSSVGGLVGLYGFTGYGASKFALRGFAEALQMEVKHYGISVTLGFPPDTDTPGLHEENKVKPLETKLISESAGVYPVETVAESLLKDTLAGDFFSSTGFDGNLSTVICAGMSPMSSVFGLVVQVCFGGLFRLVSLGYLYYFNGIVAKCEETKEKQKKAE